MPSAYALRGTVSRAVLAAALVVCCGAGACVRDREYEGRGVVESIDGPRLHAVIRHEAIPGFMVAMTMRFGVESSTVLDGIAPGETVAFALRARGGELTLLRVTRATGAAPPG